jgi:hypothetical protein
MAHEMAGFPPDSPGPLGGNPWGGWGSENGYSMRLIFFGEKPGIAIGHGENPTDTLLFVGPVTLNYSGSSSLLLHFVRVVNSSKEKSEHETEHQDQSLKEDLWFEKLRRSARVIHYRFAEVIQIKNGV